VTEGKTDVCWQEQLESILAESVASARERERQAFDQIAGPWAQSVVVYGAGNLGRKVLRGLRKHNVEPIAFADANPSLDGKRIEGVPVFSPEEAAHRFRKEAVFVVCVWHPDREHGVQDIINRLSAIGVERVTSFVPLFWKFAETFLPYYLWDLPSTLLGQTAAIGEACEALEHESLGQLASELQLRLLGNFGAMPTPLRTPQYFARELFELSDAECFVDCGAYDGDTIRDFVSAAAGKFRRLIAFEADRDNFQRLRAYVGEQPRIISDRIKILEVAVSRTSGELRFASTAGTDAAVSATGDVIIASTSLDDALAGEAPTIVKMDIEGSEMDALEGAAQVITAHKPLLAICVYHCSEHLWAIPLRLRKVEPEAKLFLRSYAVDGWESVCYAVPPGRNMYSGN
jgi:FkbM family methyltransferase